ncbi:glycosyltransferase [Sinirhodobacter populi]|uniref:Glycosyltransferase n=2 Tax=Paenirhodobacter populi TaxID=2306993 RepID=A0A443K5T6_9RHOB|nr:glycosyltransferase [Sinirhodobacter populi]
MGIRTSPPCPCVNFSGRGGALCRNRPSYPKVSRSCGQSPAPSPRRGLAHPPPNPYGGRNRKPTIPMPSASRYDAARRLLSHFYHIRMRAKLRNIALPSGGGKITEISLKDGFITLSGQASQPFRLVSDRASASLFPRQDGQFQAVLEGARYLTIADAAQDGETVTFLLGRRRDHVLAALRCATVLAAFPLQHHRDLRAYFLRGDSEAGDRLERSLLPILAPAGGIPVPRGATGLPPAPRPAPPVPQDRPAVVILPVYNAADLVRECLDHLGRNTTCPHRVLIIDDASPDPAIRPLLEAWVAAHPQAELLRNPENLGFVGTVNRGLAHAAGHDVVLLNSDAMVPPGWLERLLRALHENDEIASVTPLSNDAEIFAAPVECRPRILAPGEAEAADRMAARLDGTVAWAEAPTGVGFCMAMRREWLERLPQLDTIFGRGYGEEVDWCRRTAALGARHVGTGTLFVEHRSGSSFGDEKPARVQANNRIISARYPGYDLMVQQFRDRDPLAGPRLAVGLALLAGRRDRPERGFPVWLAHRWGGGAELWLNGRIAEDIAQENGALVLRDASEERDAPEGAVLAELHSAEGITRVILEGEDMARLLAQIPVPLAIGYSCLAGARDPLGFMRRLDETLTLRARDGDSLTFLFHDYLPLCPSYTLMGANRQYCGLPRPEACQKCYAALPVTSGRRPARIAEWRAEWLRLARRAREIVVFSADSRRHVETVWPELAPKIRLAPHEAGHLPPPVAPGGSAALTVGVLGAIGYNKGAAILRDLAARTGKSFRLVLIGKIDPAYAHPGMTIHGPYQRDEIAELARRYALDCWFLPSIWPETFSYTVHECLATGLPVLGFDLGAQGDSLRQAPNGIVLPLGTPLTPELFAQSLGRDPLAAVATGKSAARPAPHDN